MSPLDRPVPPAGEEIHIPGPSIQPVLLAAGHHGDAARDHDLLPGAADRRRAADPRRADRLDPRRPPGVRGAPGRRTDGQPDYAVALRHSCLGGTSQDAPSSVQQRTTSRTDRTPTTSPPSMTMRWRKLPRTICRGGLLERPVGRGVDDVGASGGRRPSRWSTSSPRADREEDVALGDDARALALGVHDDRGADAAAGHLLRRLAQRSARARPSGPPCSSRHGPAFRPPVDLATFVAMYTPRARAWRPSVDAPCLTVARATLIRARC